MRHFVHDYVLQTLRRLLGQIGIKADALSVPSLQLSPFVFIPLPQNIVSTFTPRSPVSHLTINGATAF